MAKQQSPNRYTITNKNEFPVPTSEAVGQQRAQLSRAKIPIEPRYSETGHSNQDVVKKTIETLLEPTRNTQAVNNGGNNSAAIGQEQLSPRLLASNPTVNRVK